jgi:tetratricopeptide (TPR) repeat protein
MLSDMRSLLLGILLFGLLCTEAGAQGQNRAPRSVESLAGESLSRLSAEAAAHYTRGHKQLRGQELNEAIESFTQVIELQDDFAAAYLSRAQAYRQLEMQSRTVEDRDRAALGYINDERHVTKKLSSAFVLGDLNEVLAKRTIALLVIYFTFWLAIVYLMWQAGPSLPLSFAIGVLTSALMLFAPDGPYRYGFAVAGLTVQIVAAYSKYKPQKNVDAQEDQLIEAELRRVREKTPLARTEDYETETKVCPSCSREVSQIARVCPRCSHRFGN